MDGQDACAKDVFVRLFVEQVIDVQHKRQAEVGEDEVELQREKKDETRDSKEGRERPRIGCRPSLLKPL